MGEMITWCLCCMVFVCPISHRTGKSDKSCLENSVTIIKVLDETQLLGKKVMSVYVSLLWL